MGQEAVRSNCSHEVRWRQRTTRSDEAGGGGGALEYLSKEAQRAFELSFHVAKALRSQAKYIFEIFPALVSNRQDKTKMGR